MDDLLTIIIEDIREEAEGTKSFFSSIPAGMTWDAGSDAHFAFPEFMRSGVPDKTLIRHMSLMTLPAEGRLGFTTRVPGSGSKYKKRLDSLVPGDELVMFKQGNRFPLRREYRPITLISMGVGAAAVRPMVMSWLHDKTGIPSITNLVVDKENQFVFRKEFESASGLMNIFSENRISFYNEFESFSVDENMIFYIVGTDSFLEDVIKRLRAKGVSPDSIEIDKKTDKKAEMLG